VDVGRQPPALQRQFLDFIVSSCTQVATLNDATYGQIDIYRVTETPTGSIDQ
jgi:hypothetical protein